MWLCSGQSNMEWSVADARDGDLEIPAANYPNIRLITVGHGRQPDAGRQISTAIGKSARRRRFRSSRRSDITSAATCCRTVKVPIGLIDNSWGGSACEAWIRRDLLEGNPLYADRCWPKWDKTVAEFDEKKAKAEFDKQAGRVGAQAAAARGSAARRSRRTSRGGPIR